MSTIATVGRAGSAWSDLTASRASARKDKPYDQADVQGDGTVDTSELHGMLDQIASKTGIPAGNAADLMSALQTEGSGSLGQDTPSAGMQSLMPAPASTVDFAQQRSSDDGADAVFASMDTDGDGTISKAEFDNAVSGTDALDGSDDDTVDSTEVAAGQFNDLVSSLGAALDNSSTGSLSAGQADAYKRQFDAAIASMSSASSGSDSSSNSTTAAAQDRSFDMSALADLAMRRYTQNAASESQAAGLSVAA